MIPKDQISAWMSYYWPFITSGAMLKLLPTVVPIVALDNSFFIFAKPKSAIL
jgi:hypothetical protein